MSRKMATERYAFGVAGGGMGTISTKCCTKARAEEIGCKVNGDYAANQLVAEEDLERKAVTVYINSIANNLTYIVGSKQRKTFNTGDELPEGIAHLFEYYDIPDDRYISGTYIITFSENITNYYIHVGTASMVRVSGNMLIFQVRNAFNDGVQVAAEVWFEGWAKNIGALFEIAFTL